MTKSVKTTLLTILDGWGHRQISENNAIDQAKTPNWDTAWQTQPHILLAACGKAVGLPREQMGNSEVGHMNIGTGRIVYQDLTRIDNAIESGDFAKNPQLQQAFAQAKGHRLHILGLASPGGVHSQAQHLLALIQLAKAANLHIALHAFLDGRDTPPRSAQATLVELQDALGEHGQIASIIGRYYAMDRDKRWERTQSAYDLLCEAKAAFHAPDAITALEQAYARNENDEFVQATQIGKPHPIQDGDVVLFMNFRSDRARQLSYAFTDDHFSGFTRNKRPKLAGFYTLTSYADDIASQVLFPKQTYRNSLGEVVADLGLKQLRAAETEKYAHVTFFFNGGIETPFDHEDRKLINSPKVATYDLQPEMSAPALTKYLCEAIASQQYDLIVCNYANPDMVGHTGNFDATVQAIECIDQCLGELMAAIAAVDGQMLVTADHGNAEMMFDEKTQQPHTAHTFELVPLMYIGKPAKIKKSEGILADIAPTILSLMGLTAPEEMTGDVIFEHEA